MYLRVHFQEGVSYDLLVRQMELILALSERFKVAFAFPKPGLEKPWCGLLSSTQLRQAKRLVSRHPAFPPGAPCASLYFAAPGGGAHPLEADSFLLFLTPPFPALSDPTPFRSVFGFSALQPDANDSQAPCCITVPYAADLHTFTAPTGKRRSSRVLLLGRGDASLDRQYIAWLVSLGRTDILLFDPYLDEFDDRPESDGPVNLTFAPICEPAKRAELFRSCGEALVAHSVFAPGDHFLMEAESCGCIGLEQRMDPAPDTWSEPLLARALERAREQGNRPSAPVEWRRVVDVLTTPLSPPQPHERVMAGGRPFDFHYDASAALEQLATTPLATTSLATTSLATSPPPVLLLLVGPEDRLTEEQLRLCSSLEEIHCHGSDDLADTIPDDDLRRRVNRVDDLKRFLAGRIFSADRRPVLVLALPQGGALAHRAMRQTRRYEAHARRSAPPPDRPISLLLTAHKSALGQSDVPPVGVNIATRDMFRGLHLNATEDVELLWLKSTLDRDRSVKACFHEAHNYEEEVDPDEVLSWHLPAFLQSGACDLVFHSSPNLYWSASARAVWAPNNLPVVGILHQLNIVGDVVRKALLTSPSFPYDRIISPSACGARSFERYLETECEWFSRNHGLSLSYQGRIEVIPYGIETARYGGLDRASCRRALEVPLDALIVMYLGRLSRYSKADLIPLLFAFRSVAKTHRNARLLLAGGNPERYDRQLRKVSRQLGIGDRVLYKTDFSDNEKYLLYGAADIFVSPADNLQETFGLSILEAMAAGLPVIASEWNGYRELVRHEETGFLVPTRWAMPTQEQQCADSLIFGWTNSNEDLPQSVAVDVPVLARTLELLADNEPLRRELGRRGREVCCAEYDYLVRGKQVTQCLLSAVEQARRTPRIERAKRSFMPFYDRLGERFGHFPTETHFEDKVVAVSDDIVSSDEKWAVVEGLVFTSALEKDVARYLLAQAKADKRATVRELAQGAAATFKDREEIMRQHIVRCLKYDLLKLC